jgi:arylmalonate decarboxylase
MISSWRKESVHLADNLRNFLKSEGIEIAAVEGIGNRQLSSCEKLALTPAEIYRNALEACQKHPEADAVYIQSGTMATMGIIDPLEQQIGKPVVSSNSANIWGSFKPLNIKVGPGFGRLLANI